MRLVRSGMARLVYVANVSLDGFTEDEGGAFDWTEPADDVFAFITDLIRPIGTHLLGRRMYQTMAVWETDPAFALHSELMGEFARVWNAAAKIVYSTTLTTVATARTRLVSRFDPEEVRRMKASSSGDLAVGGPNLAAQAFRAKLVDECQLFVHPVLIGGGKPALPRNWRADIELLDERRFDGGVVYLRYRISN
jgi:dihydrofolate reductase